MKVVLDEVEATSNLGCVCLRVGAELVAVLSVEKAESLLLELRDATGCARLEEEESRNERNVSEVDED